MGFIVERVKRERVVPVYRNVKCDHCKRRVAPQEITEESSLQYDNVLLLAMRGGYGMFIDPVGLILGEPPDALSEETTKVLCHDCAHEFLDWLGVDRAEAEGWHSHRNG